MIAWLLSFVPLYVWLLAALAASGLAWTYLGHRAAIAIMAGVALFAAYETGARGERKRGEAATLRATVETMKRQQQTALEIQTRMAERMAELRAAQQERQGKTDVVVETFRKEPAAPGFTDADVVRLRTIRIGRSGSAASRR